MRLSFLTLPRGNALGDALRHKSAARRNFLIGLGPSISPDEKKPRNDQVVRGFFLGFYRPAAARRASARSVFSQVKAVKVSSPTVISTGIRPKWP
ncbi:hypothetical protein B1F73_25920 [Pseudomonas syringae]|nr:DUF1534 domain-containing protein [Pseudomonas syringae pv. dysoxyli]NAP21285.1 DUF1534 domain-containing protein [Pseudomonas syringae]NAP24418.1 DUF1534 domain-containing protein [Pseudomonas syringae]RXT76690.1 hypothetical protein B1F77_13335 [Pseudomonas syringae]RXT82021.1 hypothetical protein B1F72_25580 [Pseudomonas syringae]